MITQAGGDATNIWQKQLFIGQIPYEWGEKELTEYLAKSLHIHDPNEIQSQLRIDSFPNPKESQNERQKKHAFIRVKDVGFHKQLLSDKFKCADGFTLNIKESAQEQNKRKLFFGRLSDEITKEKMIDMIEMVRSGSKNEIEDEFPQVPVKKPGKSRTAFVLFKTHQIAKEVKESFKKLADKNMLEDQLDKKKILQDCSQNRNVDDLVRAVDYHRKRKDQSYPYRLGSNGVHIDDGEVRVGWSLDEHTNRINFTHTISWQGYEMVIQLHENDLDGEFPFGQDSRIILAKKANLERNGLNRTRINHQSRVNHRRRSRENQNRRIEHLFSNLNISNNQNRTRTSLRATSSASSVPSTSRSSNHRSEQSANQQPLHLARDARSESSMFKRQVN